MMDTNVLLMIRASIIYWTWMAVAPLEIVFDAIESELESRGVRL